MAENLWIKPEPLTTMEAMGTKFGKCEVGGLLMGYIGDNGDPVVTEVVGAGKNAKHSPRGFIPDYKFHQSEINRIHHETNGMTIYLGDWHTHPAGIARLSYQDKTTLKRMGKAYRPMGNEPFMLILAKEKGLWCLGAFQNVKALFGFHASKELHCIKIK